MTVSRATHSVGMVLDRALTPALLDVALRVATQHPAAADARRLLTTALGDHVSQQEAEGKTKKCLTRAWVVPPSDASSMIAWAVDHQHLDPGRTVLHLGALLATFPFVGTVARIVGRQLALDGAVDQRRVRAEATAALGDRSTIDVGARKVVTTLRYLGLLVGDDGTPLAPASTMPAVPAVLHGWLTHALLLTRQVSAIAVDDVARAPELALLAVPPPGADDYPLLERHTEASRIVAVPRPAVG